jgi:hypothetical protein
VTDASGVTSIAIDTGVAVETEVAPMLEPSVAGSILPDQIKSVAEYLAKPVLIASGSWGSGNVVNSQLYSGDVVPMMTSVDMWREKLQGYYGARFTTSLRLTLNGTPFHAGILSMRYYPAPETNLPRITEHTTSYTNFNQLPGVFLTPSEESVVLKIPYLSPLRFVELTSSTRVSPARVMIHVLLPLTVGASGAPSITWNLWMSVEEVQLFGQSSTIVPQSDAPRRRPNVKSRRSIPEQEHTPVSSFLSGVSQSVSAFSGVPSIAPFVAPTQWMLNAASLTAGALGWSKPAHDDMNNRVSRSNHWNIASSTGVDNAQKLSLFSDNKLMVLDDSTIGSQDQCSIAFIKKQFAPWTSLSLTTSQNVGDQIFTTELRPDVFQQTSGSTLFLTPVAYLAAHFLMYRGSLEFKFKFAKTAFHAGQIQFSFVPGPAPVTLGFNDSPKAYRLVFDLQDADEVCVRVPYVIPRDYTYRDVSFGRLYVHVLTPLRAPETCAQVVTASTFVRGGDDFEVACPRLFSLTPGSFVPPVAPALEAQGGSTEVTGDLCHTMGEDDPLGTTVFSAHSQGEHVSSMLSLLKRYEQIVLGPIPRNRFRIIQPWIIFSTYSAPASRSDRHSSILSCYAFMRGGSRLRLVTLGDTNQCTLFENWNNGVAAEWLGDLTMSRVTNANFPVVVSRVQYDKAGEGGAAAFSYQSNYRFSPTQWIGYTTLTVPNIYQPTGTCGFQGYATDAGGESSNRLLFRAFDDDFQPIFWVGVPAHTVVP